MSLLSSTEIAGLTGVYNDLFDTFKQEILVIKEPIRSVVSAGSSDLWKYGNTSNEDNFTYTPVSGIFFGLVDVDLKPKDTFLSDIEQKAQSETLSIQVYDDFRRYVSDGMKVQCVNIKNHSYELMTEDIHDPFLSLDIYQYRLKLIKWYASHD